MTSFLAQFRDAPPEPSRRDDDAFSWSEFAHTGQGYGRAALDREVEVLARMRQPGRNHALNRAMFSLAQLVAGGELKVTEVTAAVYAACVSNGLVRDDGERSVRATIDSGLRAGTLRPRSAPERPSGLVLPNGAQASSAGEPEEGDAYLAARFAAQVEAEVVRLRIRDRAAGMFVLETEAERRRAASTTNRVVSGDVWVLDAPPEEKPIWGLGDDVLWARGEALMIAGPQGTGKTTLAGQLVRGCVGLMPEVLGYPIVATQGKVLYLAMDRPAQARRNLGRLFGPHERDVLAEKLSVWCGPPPADLAASPAVLLDMCEVHGATTVVVDSLKDAALGLSKDEVGAGYNRARQEAIAAGVQVLELHHVVKNGADGSQPRHLRDIYGSAWLTNGVGSVLMLWGEAGDPLIEVAHLKQPINQIGPLRILHDAQTGMSSIYGDDERDVLTVARRMPSGITAVDAACAMFAVEAPTRTQVERARRKLQALERAGLMRYEATGTGRGHSASWVAIDDAEWVDEPDRRYR